MITRTNAGILAVSLLVGAGTFVTTRSTHGQSTGTSTASVPADTRPRWGRLEMLARWLNLTEDQRRQIVEKDSGFWKEVMDLRESLAGERDKLAKLLEDPKATDQQISEQFEKMISEGNQLERRVVKHLLSVRGSLTPEQQEKLLGLCARGVRQNMGWCGGPGGMGPGPRGMGGPGGPGWGRFRGGAGMGQGPGQGMGQRWRPQQPVTSQPK